MSAQPIRQRGGVEIVAEIADAARALQTTTDTWRSFLPRPGALTDAQTCVAGLQRSLADLAVAMEASRHE